MPPPRCPRRTLTVDHSESQKTAAEQKLPLFFSSEALIVSYSPLQLSLSPSLEVQMRKYGSPASPPPPSPPQQLKKIPVVYYLCRNRHLEHPHFIEVPIFSPEGLYLRDVINRLNVLRGKGMPAMYSWSCKRSYKNGFVWHDLSEDDLILPAHGNEYVLKGSELMDQSPPDRAHQGGVNHRLQNPKISQQETPTSSRTQEASSSSSPTIAIIEAKAPPSPPPPPREAEHSPNGNISPESRRLKSWEAGSPGPEEYMVYKPHAAADASTQTDDRGARRVRVPRETFTRGISTDDRSSSDPRFDKATDEISPPPTSSSASTSGGKTETLESLIRAEASKMNSFRILEEEEVFVPVTSKLKATNVLMQLITCGSISVKDHHSFGLVPTYRPRFSHMKFSSPMFAGSMMMGELDCLSDNPRLMGLRMEDKEFFSGSFIETNKYKEELGPCVPTLKRSSSYNADRICSPDSKTDKDREADSSSSKCLPRTIKISSNRHSKNETMRSPISDYQRNSSAAPDCGQSSIGESSRFADASSLKGSSVRLESFKEEKEKVIKIEERLISGARVIIQSRAPCDDSEGSSSS